MFARLYRACVFDQPRLMAAVIGMLVVFFGFHAAALRFDASADALLLENDQHLSVWRDVQKRYGGNELLIVSVTPLTPLFEPAGLDLLSQMSASLEKIDSVESIFGLLDAPLLKQSRFPGQFPTLRTPLVDLGEAQQELLSSSLIERMLLSEDGKTTALLLSMDEPSAITRLRESRDDLRSLKAASGLTTAQTRTLAEINRKFTALRVRQDTKRHEDIAEIRTRLNRFEAQAEVYLGGTPMIADDMITFVRNDLVVFGAAALVLIVVMLTYLFRRIRWVILPLLNCAISTIVMFGVLGWTGWEITIISSNFVSLMVIMTLSINVHLIVSWQQTHAATPNATVRELVERTMFQLWRPCLFTMLTTAIGFTSLVFSGIKPVINFGAMMSVGIFVALLVTFVVFPTLLLLFPPTTAVQPNASNPGLRITTNLAKFTLNHGWSVIAVSLVLAGISAAGIPRLQVENSFIDYFRSSTEIYKGMKRIDERLGGTTPLDVLVTMPIDETLDCEGDACDELEDFLDGPTDPTNTWFTVDRVATVEAIHDFLEQQPEIGKVLSLSSTLRTATEMNNGRPLTSFDISVLYKRLPVGLREVLIDPYVDFEADEARIAARILDSKPGIRRHELIERLKAQLPEVAGNGASVVLSGTLVLYDNVLQSLFQSQYQTAGVVILGIGLMLCVLFRSVKVALVGLVPNVLAAALVLSVMGWFGLPLDMMTITMVAITLGIAVDDTIHYLYRFREECEQGASYPQALKRCHSSVGQAMLYTSAIVVLGFAIFAGSNFTPTIYFGLLTAVGMTLALLAALTLLPRLVVLVQPFGRAPV